MGHAREIPSWSERGKQMRQANKETLEHSERPTRE